MAVVQNTLIGKSSGSVGGATFSSWKGLNILKSKAVSVANPKTIGQQTQRNRLSLMVPLYRLIAFIVTIGYKGQAIGKSEYNAFMGDNLQTATAVGVAPLVDFVPANLQISKGSMGVTAPTSITRVAGQADVVINFSPAIIPLGGSLTDEIHAVAYNHDKDIWTAPAVPTLRNTGSITITFDDDMVAGDVVSVYFFAKSSTSDNVSTSLRSGGVSA